MSIEPGPSPSASPQNDFGSLQGCFVEGSPEQRKRERRIRRRALIISVAAQAAILAAIILVPLFGKPQHIALANMTPIPPYYRAGRLHAPTLLRDQTSHTSELFPTTSFLSRRVFLTVSMRPLNLHLQSCPEFQQRQDQAPRALDAFQ